RAALAGYWPIRRTGRAATGSPRASDSCAVSSVHSPHPFDRAGPPRRRAYTPFDHTERTNVLVEGRRIGKITCSGRRGEPPTPSTKLLGGRAATIPPNRSVQAAREASTMALQEAQPGPAGSAGPRGATRWDPDQYLKFADHRLRPSLELLARVP